MRVIRRALLGILVAASATGAQTPDSTARRQQRALDSLSTSVRALQQRLDSLERAPAPVASAPARASGTYMNMGFDALSVFGWSTTSDVASLQRGDHDPQVRGFTVPNVELTFDAAVDPYFKGFSAIVTKLDANGNTAVELEEAWAQTTSLPANLQVKAGQFLGDFGRQNAQHPHAWAFVDQPLVLNQMFGPDGLRGQGARVSWLAPTETYVEASLSLMNSAGGTTWSFRSEESTQIHGGTPVERPVDGFSDLLVVPRITSSVDLSDTQTLVVGASGAFGPNNSGAGARTSLFGGDVYYKWKPEVSTAGFPFFSLQAEAISRKYDAAARRDADTGLNLPKETLNDWGAYSQALWGIRPRIVAGLRGEILRNSASGFDAAGRQDRERISPNFTWYPTEFSKLRLQYNYDRRDALRDEHSLWIQFEFMMGAHAAHKF